MNESSPEKTVVRVRTHASNAFHCHITSLRVPFYEVDMGQALYHGNYYHILELGREDMLRKAGFPYREFLNRELHLTIVESYCKYRKALHYEDKIEIRTRISSLGRRSVSFSQLIYRLTEDQSGREAKGPEPELCTESRLNMICVSFTGQPATLPQEFRRAVETIPMMPKETTPDIILKPIGVIHSPILDTLHAPRQGSESAIGGQLVVDEQYKDAFLGLEKGKKIVILYWMHLAERDILQVHPRGNRSRPLRGVFTTRSPQRPNPISADVVEVTGVRGTVIDVIGLDAVDGTPLLDIKCIT